MNNEQKEALKAVEELNQYLEKEYAPEYDGMPQFVITITSDFYGISYSIPDEENPIELQIFNSANNKWDDECYTIKEYLIHSLDNVRNSIDYHDSYRSA